MPYIHVCVYLRVKLFSIDPELYNGVVSLYLGTNVVLISYGPKIHVQATALITSICRNLQSAANLVEHTEYTVVLRGDSTLRGHFPEARTLIYNMLVL